MEQYIDKSALVAEIERRKQVAFGWMETASNDAIEAEFELCDDILSFLNTLEAKEVDLEKEIELIKGDYEQVDVAWNNDFDFIARHFFELGLSANNPITAADRGTAEEIIINLKRVEQDYRINLTKEIEWVRNQAQKGEEV